MVWYKFLKHNIVRNRNINSSVYWSNNSNNNKNLKKIQILDLLSGTPSQPVGLAPLQPSSIQPASTNISSKSSTSVSSVGPTWINSGGLNIDIDNLTISGSKLNNKREPSMNQLAINSPTSPNAKVPGMGGSSSMKTPNVFLPFK